MNRSVWLVFWGAVATAAVACGPDARPEEPCNGPSFNLVVRAENAPLPPDTRINVRYGANLEGEPYALGKPSNPQAVHCSEDSSPGGAPSVEPGAGGADSGSGGASSGPDDGVWSLRCLLYTQGPAELDVTATGYEKIEGRSLPLTREHRCDVELYVTLQPLKPDDEP